MTYARALLVLLLLAGPAAAALPPEAIEAQKRGARHHVQVVLHEVRVPDELPGPCTALAEVVTVFRTGAPALEVGDRFEVTESCHASLAEAPVGGPVLLADTWRAARFLEVYLDDTEPRASLRLPWRVIEAPSEVPLHPAVYPEGLDPARALDRLDELVRAALAGSLPPVAVPAGWVVLPSMPGGHALLTAHPPDWWMQVGEAPGGYAVRLDGPGGSVLLAAAGRTGGEDLWTLVDSAFGATPLGHPGRHTRELRGWVEYPAHDWAVGVRALGSEGHFAWAVAIGPPRTMPAPGHDSYRLWVLATPAGSFERVTLEVLLPLLALAWSAPG